MGRTLPYLRQIQVIQSNGFSTIRAMFNPLGWILGSLEAAASSAERAAHIQGIAGAILIAIITICVIMVNVHKEGG
jgi:hypothetical protein